MTGRLAMLLRFLFGQSGACCPDCKKFNRRTTAENLQGDSGKMSASVPTSSIFVSDSPKDIASKVRGGQTAVYLVSFEPG